MSADIDLDLADRDQVLSLIHHVPARLENGRRHISGVYVTDIPRDPLSGLAAIDYHAADKRGYIKLDLLHVSVYNLIRDQDHYQQLLQTEPPWPRLWGDPDWAKKLIHIGDYHDLLARMRPDSIPRMAAFISVIRPGKSHLQQCSWQQIFSEVWDGDTSRGYVFKKSHAISYAVLVALHMNILNTD